jgi:hypothetical protein
VEGVRVGSWWGVPPGSLIAAAASAWVVARSGQPVESLHVWAASDLSAGNPSRNQGLSPVAQPSSNGTTRLRIRQREGHSSTTFSLVRPGTIRSPSEVLPDVHPRPPRTDRSAPQGMAPGREVRDRPRRRPRPLRRRARPRLVRRQPPPARSAGRRMRAPPFRGRHAPGGAADQGHPAAAGHGSSRERGTRRAEARSSAGRRAPS